MLLAVLLMKCVLVSHRVELAYSPPPALPVLRLFSKRLLAAVTAPSPPPLLSVLRLFSNGRPAPPPTLLAVLLMKWVLVSHRVELAYSPPPALFVLRLFSKRLFTAVAAPSASLAPPPANIAVLLRKWVLVSHRVELVYSPPPALVRAAVVLEAAVHRRHCAVSSRPAAKVADAVLLKTCTLLRVSAPCAQTPPPQPAPGQ
jgi:hypothetical protein